MECDACRAKPGSPTLCVACLHNRALVGERDVLLEFISGLALAAQQQCLNPEVRSLLMRDIRSACRGELPAWYKAEKGFT